MRKAAKAVLLTLVFITASWATLVAYATVSTIAARSEGPSGLVCYVATKYTSEELPSDWYTAEELGIVEVEHYNHNHSYYWINVDPKKEPFPLQAETPVFEYKGIYFQVSSFIIDFSYTDEPVPWETYAICTGVTLAAAWIVSGAAYTLGRKKPT